ncbi:hypothetical protein [Labrys neptuniae]
MRQKSRTGKVPADQVIKGTTARAATSDEVKVLRKEAVSGQALELRLLKKA